MLPNMPASPNMPAAPKSGDIKLLMIDALRGMISTAEQSGMDFDAILAEARQAGTSETPASPEPAPNLPGLV